MRRYQAGHLAKPATIYRALSRLTELGLAHRVLSLDAFVACRLGLGEHQPAFIICADCNRLDEVVGDAEWATLVQPGFELIRLTAEAYGTCADCASRRGPTPTASTG